MKKLTQSRWGWFLQGLPNFARASAMFRIKRYTMTTPKRCRLLWNQCQLLMARQVPGCFVECGVWRGGSSGIMGLALRHAGHNRGLHLFDSFEGLPEPTSIDGHEAAKYSCWRASGNLTSIGKCQAGRKEVEQLLFEQLHLPRSQVHFHVGWFQKTIPADADHIEAIALLRLDGDWYESTMVCLNYLYPKLSSGGIVLLDDYYAWAGCKKAADEYRERHGIKNTIQRIDIDAAYWIKD